MFFLLLAGVVLLFATKQSLELIDPGFKSTTASTSVGHPYMLVMRMVVIVLIVVASLSGSRQELNAIQESVTNRPQTSSDGSGAGKRQVRRWQDNTGTFDVSASLMYVNLPDVFLETADHRVLRSPIERFSDPDQDHIRKHIVANDPFEPPVATLSTDQLGLVIVSLIGDRRAFFFKGFIFKNEAGQVYVVTPPISRVLRERHQRAGQVNGKIALHIVGQTSTIELKEHIGDELSEYWFFKVSSDILPAPLSIAIEHENIQESMAVSFVRLGIKGQDSEKDVDVDIRFRTSDGFTKEVFRNAKGEVTGFRASAFKPGLENEAWAINRDGRVIGGPSNRSGVFAMPVDPAEYLKQLVKESSDE